jgi:hypothetical protein
VKIDPAERRDMRAAVKGMRTKADKIRALAAAGHERAKMASFLGIRYQHVRNVLVRLEARFPMGVPPSRGTGLAEPAAPLTEWQESGPDQEPTYGSFVIDEHGRIMLPRNVIAALDGEPQRPIPWRFEDGELKLMNRAAGIRWAQELAARSPNAHLISSDALIAERRAEAVREDERYARWRRD